MTAAFWTEHSPRSTLPSWVACLGKFPSDWCDLLGRRGSSRGEGYVRTHRARVHLMQEAVSENFRSCASPHALYDEQALFTELRDFLEKKEVDEAMQEVQIGNLTLDGDGVPLAEAAVENPPDVGTVSDEEEVKVVQVSKHSKDVTAASGSLKGMFVVGISGRIRRLHQVGRCHRVPGVDYARYEVIGPTEPPAHMYTARCGHCWSKKEKAASSRTPTAESSSTSCSSSSSASE